nr:YetF domain-containing protein [uncultured Dyadobacter sp.]
MKKEDIVPGDFYRILFGEAPVEFMLEVLIRTLIIYIVLLVVVRFMGKRMGGQLTIAELAVMITLGAIVSPGMQMPQTGLLVCTLILLCALIFQRGINWLEFKSKWFEARSQGVASTLVKDGVMQLEVMSSTKVSRQQLFAALRSEKIYNLGEVERVYLEACGLFSIYRKDGAWPGLLLFPPDDESMNGFGQQVKSGTVVCANCGTVAEQEHRQDLCPECGADQWGKANISTRSEVKQQTS